MENEKDICKCGDYRKNHPNNGACNLNGLGHSIPSNEPESKCLQFRLSIKGVINAESQVNKGTED